VAGLYPDPLWELTPSPNRLAGFQGYGKGVVGKGREGEGTKENDEGKRDLRKAGRGSVDIA